MKIKLKTLLDLDKLRFGDYVLFQEYKQCPHDGTQYSYQVTKPILGLFVGFVACDQTIEVEYIRVKNTERDFEYTNLRSHIEWDDYSNVLGHWRSRPDWKALLGAYRTAAPVEVVLSDSINWSDE